MSNEETASDPGSYLVVDTDKALQRVLSAVARLDRVPFDTEGNGLYKYHQRVCLMQITADDETYIVDPMAGIDLSPLLDLLRERELILHAADYDLRMLRATFDFAPEAKVFDTMLAAQLLGVEELGLVTVAKKYLDVDLTKYGQKSDWTRRPLSDRQLAYASDDTRHLDPLATALENELERLGRLAWHEEMCARMVRSTADNGPKTDPWRIKGSGLLRAEELIFLKLLWEWREREASEADVPPFKILGNAALMDISKWAAANRHTRLKDVPHVPKSMRPNRRGGLMAALRQARATPKSEWPQPPLRGERPPSSPGFKKRVAHLQRECGKLAGKLNLPASVIAPRSAIIDIARQHCVTAEDLFEKTNLMRWQADLLAPTIGDGYLRLIDSRGDDDEERITP